MKFNVPVCQLIIGLLIHVNFQTTLKIFRFGAPGVEFTGIHPDVNQVLQLHFLHGEV